MAEKKPSKRHEERLKAINEFRELLARDIERRRSLGEDVGPEGWYKTREGRARRLRELLERRGPGEQPANG
jgi:hypothetical protein